MRDGHLLDQPGCLAQILAGRTSEQQTERDRQKRSRWSDDQSLRALQQPSRVAQRRIIDRLRGCKIEWRRVIDLSRVTYLSECCAPASAWPARRRRCDQSRCGRAAAAVSIRDHCRGPFPPGPRPTATGRQHLLRSNCLLNQLPKVRSGRVQGGVGVVVRGLRLRDCGVQILDHLGAGHLSFRTSRVQLGALVQQPIKIVLVNVTQPDCLANRGVALQLFEPRRQLGNLGAGDRGLRELRAEEHLGIVILRLLIGPEWVNRLRRRRDTA